LERLRWRGLWFEASPRKNFMRLPFQPMVENVLYSCHPNYRGKPKIRGLWLRLAWVNSKTLYIKKKSREKGWRHGSINRVLV
jgi:hypothetical protein